MRKLYLLLAATIAAAGLWGGYIYWKYRVPPGITFRALRVISETNAERPLQGPAIVVFGQSWCHDCHRELPRLHSAWRKNFARTAIFVISDEDSETVEKWRKQLNLPFSFYRVRGSLDELGVNSYPTTYILDKDLKVIYSKVGPVAWENESIKAYITAQN